MKVRICDVCKEPMSIPTHKVKIKKEWRSFHESGWVKYEICDKCADRIIYAISEEEVNADERRQL